jgi:hypothetical protein
MSKFKFELKSIGNNMLATVENGVGFSLAHIINRKLPAKFKSGLMGFGIAIAMVAIGAVISLNVANKHVQNIAQGFGTYSLIRSINSLTDAAPQINGLGILPEGFKAVLATYVPNLGNAYSHPDFQIFGPGTQIPAQNATYELLPSGPLNLTDLNGMQPEIHGVGSNMGYISNAA